jgi:hypothetical protein
VEPGVALLEEVGLNLFATAIWHFIGGAAVSARELSAFHASLFDALTVAVQRVVDPGGTGARKPASVTRYDGSDLVLEERARGVARGLIEHLDNSTIPVSLRADVDLGHQLATWLRASWAPLAAAEVPGGPSYAERVGINLDLLAERTTALLPIHLYLRGRGNGTLRRLADALSHTFLVNFAEIAATAELNRQAFSQTTVPVDYRSEIGDLIARETEAFVGRADLIEHLTAVPPGQCFIVEGPPGRGKTALFCELIRRHELRMTGRNQSDHLIFYRFDGRDRGRAPYFFAAINSQLLAVTGVDEALPSDAVQLQRQFDRLWAFAANGPMRLVLLIDGLEYLEDTELSSLMPSYLGTSAAIIATSRPNPAVIDRVPIDHPARGSRVFGLELLELGDIEAMFRELPSLRQLSPRAVATTVHGATRGDPLYAKALYGELHRLGDSLDRQSVEAMCSRTPPSVRDYFGAQVRHLERGALDVGVHELALLFACARQPVSSGEIADLLGESLVSVRSRLRVLGQFLTGVERWEFSHSEFRGASLALFSATELDTMKRRLFEWCSKYDELGWPESSPPYAVEQWIPHVIEHDPKRLGHSLSTAWAVQRLRLALSPIPLEADLELATRHFTEKETNVSGLMKSAALRCAVRSVVTGFPPDLISATAHTHATNAGQAMAVLVEPLSTRAGIMLNHAWACFVRGSRERATALANHVSELLDAIPDSASSRPVAAGLAELLWSLGDRRSATGVLKRLVQAQQAQRASSDSEWVATASHILVSAGLTADAAALVERACADLEQVTRDYERMARTFTLRACEATLVNERAIDLVAAIDQWLAGYAHEADVLSVARALVQVGESGVAADLLARVDAGEWAVPATVGSVGDDADRSAWERDRTAESLAREADLSAVLKMEQRSREALHRLLRLGPLSDEEMSVATWTVALRAAKALSADTLVEEIARRLAAACTVTTDAWMELVLFQEAAQEGSYEHAPFASMRLGDRWTGLAGAVVALSATGRAEEASAVIDHAILRAERLSSAVAWARVLAGVSQVQAMAGNVVSCIDTQSSIDVEALRHSARVATAKLLAESEAEDRIRTLMDACDCAPCHVLVLRAVLDLRNIDLALQLAKTLLSSTTLSPITAHQTDTFYLAGLLVDERGAVEELARLASACIRQDRIEDAEMIESVIGHKPLAERLFGAIDLEGNNSEDPPNRRELEAILSWSRSLEDGTRRRAYLGALAEFAARNGANLDLAVAAIEASTQEAPFSDHTIGAIVAEFVRTDRLNDLPRSVAARRTIESDRSAGVPIYAAKSFAEIRYAVAELSGPRWVLEPLVELAATRLEQDFGFDAAMESLAQWFRLDGRDLEEIDAIARIADVGLAARLCFVVGPGFDVCGSAAYICFGRAEFDKAARVGAQLMRGERRDNLLLTVAREAIRADLIDIATDALRHIEAGEKRHIAAALLAARVGDESWMTHLRQVTDPGRRLDAIRETATSPRSIATMQAATTLHNLFVETTRELVISMAAEANTVGGEALETVEYIRGILDDDSVAFVDAAACTSMTDIGDLVGAETIALSAAERVRPSLLAAIAVAARSTDSDRSRRLALNALTDASRTGFGALGEVLAACPAVLAEYWPNDFDCLVDAARDTCVWSSAAGASSTGRKSAGAPARA